MYALSDFVTRHTKTHPHAENDRILYICSQYKVPPLRDVRRKDKGKWPVRDDYNWLGIGRHEGTLGCVETF